MQSKIEDALIILKSFGIPVETQTKLRRERMAKVFMAIADLKPDTSWSDAKDISNNHYLGTREIISFINKYWGENISPGSYDDIRRVDLIFPLKAFVVLKSAKNPIANTNDGTRGYSLNESAARVIRSYGYESWSSNLKEFLGGRKLLSDELERVRNLSRVKVNFKDGKELIFSPGEHNLLQKNVIESFLAIFGNNSEVLYVGDSAKKDLFINKEKLQELNFFELAHDKLPDVVAYSEEKNWLYLIEAVSTANPINENRRIDLLEATTNCTADIVFVTAFPNKNIYRKFAHDIAWETEVWIADAPEHMIHFNGDKFLGPHK